MNERIRTLAELAKTESSQWLGSKPATTITYDELEKFARLIILECTQVLFDESERLFGLYSEETDMQQAERCELCSEQCTDNIALIEKHFGVK